MLRTFLTVLIVLASGLGSRPAAAGVIFFTDRATWLAAVGAPTEGEDFNGFVADAQFRTATVTANNMSISSGTGPNGSSTNKIDVSPFEFTGFYATDGTPYLLGDLDGDSNPDLDIVFDDPVIAWGASFTGIADSGIRPTRLRVRDDGGAVIDELMLSSDSTTRELQFYGFLMTGGDIASSIRFTNDGIANDVFRIDDIEFVVPSADAPEPGSVALLSLGLLGLTAVRRARRH